MDTKELQGIRFLLRPLEAGAQRLAQWTDEVTVDEGYALAKEGAFAHEFFVIEEGTADVIQGGERLTEPAPGEFFGEIGLLETERWTASVIGTSPMRLISRSHSQFRGRTERNMPTVRRPHPHPAHARASTTHRPRLGLERERLDGELERLDHGLLSATGER